MFEHCGKIIYTKYWGILAVCWKLRKLIYTKYWGIFYVEHWEYIFTQNTEEYFMLSTMGRFIYTKYWGILCWALWEYLFTQNTDNTLC
jgi:hypothetical protein